MKFLYPEFLWAFAVLVIPIVIHLFNFKRYKTLYFSSLNFIRQVDQKTKSTQRLKHLLVLLSRLLAFTFLVLAFAQPYFPNEGSSNEAKESVLAFYIDNSFSMQARGAEGELLSQARENTRSIIEKAPLDTRFLIGTNDMSGSEERLLSKIEAFEKLDNIELSPIMRSSDEVLKWQLDRLNNDDIQSVETNVQYVFLSDFQKSNGFNNQDLETENVSFFPIKLSPQINANVYIDSLWFSSPIHRVNTQNELNISIANNSENDLENVEVMIEVGGYENEIFVSLPKNKKTVTRLSYSHKSTGIKSGKVHVVDDHIFFDDAFYLSYDVTKNVSILTLSGEDATPNIATVYDLDDFYLHEERNITNVTKDDFQGKDLLVINGANDISKGVANYLIEFVKSGGSIALFPGKEPTKNDWNFLLEQVKLARMGDAVSSGNKINSVNYDDPFFEGVFENKTDKLNLPSVSKTFRALNGGNSLSSKLVQLQNGLPLFSSSKTEGTSYMFYSSLHSDFGNFSKNALFSTILLRIGELSQRAQPDFVIIGDQTRYPIYEKISDDTPVHIANDDFDFIPQVTSASGVNYLSLNMLKDFQQLKSGNFTIKTDKTIGMISLNYNRNESLLDQYNEQEIRDKFKANGVDQITFNEIGTESTLSTIDIDKPFSYWKICIILTLIFVVIEMLLVRFLK